MTTRNAFADLVTEPIALRLNQILATVMPFGQVLDRFSSQIRVSASVGTVPTVTTVTTVTTVGGLTNFGNTTATNLALDTMATRWATCVRPRITTS